MSQSVLVLTERFYPEPFLVNEVVRDFVRRGLSVTVLTQVPSYPADVLYPGYRNFGFQIERALGARVLRFRTVLGYKKSLLKKVLNYAAFAFRSIVVLLLTGRRYDGVFVFHTGPLTLASALPLVSGARGHRAMWTQDVWPDTVFEYGFPSSRFLRVALRQFVQMVYRSCDVIGITSPGFRQAIACNVRETRIEYVPQWAPNELTLASSVRVEPFVFRYAGNVGTVQNLARVLGGFAKARASDPRLRLEIVGDGSERANLVTMVAKNHWQGVRFVDQIPMSEIMAFLQSSHFLVLPLVGSGVISKTIPAKFQAYLKAERPILGIVGGAVASLIEANSLGLVADPFSEDSIRDAFLSATNIPGSELSKMADNCRRLLDREFKREYVLEKIFELLAIPLNPTK